MRGEHGGDHGEFEGGVLEHGLPPQVETWRGGEHIHSKFSVLVCQGLNMDPLTLSPELPEDLQPLLMLLPWMVRGGNGG